MRKIIGYTAGVYDLFHVGHLRLLKNAKSLCDHLIVGVSTDELVQQYKNKTPVIPFLERSEIVQNIRFVDTVVAQENRDKVSAYKKLKFDIMFVGDDWHDTPKWQSLEEELKSYGVDVVYFPYTKGISSTKLNNLLISARKEGDNELLQSKKHEPEGTIKPETIERLKYEVLKEVRSIIHDKEYRSIERLSGQAHYYEYIELLNKNILLNKRLELNTTKRKIRILMVTHIKSQWKQSIYNTFINDDRFIVEVLVSPNFFKDGKPIKEVINSNIEAYEALKKNGINAKMAYNTTSEKYDHTLKSTEPDVIFFDFPYYHTVDNRPPHFINNGNILPAAFMGSQILDFALTCYVPYGFTSTIDWTMKGSINYLELNGHYNLPLQNMVWRYFCETESNLEHAKKKQILRGRNIRVMNGHPKIDPYFDGHNLNETPWTEKEKKNNRKKRIIWAPHHITGNNVPFSFTRLKDKFYNFAELNENVTFLFKPHPTLIYNSEVKSYIKKWLLLPNTLLHTEGNYIDLFMSSDCMVSNAGSFMLEYFPSMNPYILMRTHQGNDTAQLAAKSYYIPTSDDDVFSLIEDVIIKGNDHKKEIRKKVATEIGIQGNSADFIKNHIVSELII